MRPDLIVRLTGGKNIVVDSKVAFSAYLEAMEARDDADPGRPGSRPTPGTCAQHIDSLADKAYWERFTPTPEFVVCFVPAEAFLDAALCKKTRPCSSTASSSNARQPRGYPTLLVALLRTVAHTWRQEALATNRPSVSWARSSTSACRRTAGTSTSSDARWAARSVPTTRPSPHSESRPGHSARKMSELHVVEPTAELRRSESAHRGATRRPRRPS